MTIQTDERGHIDSSVLPTDNAEYLNCAWLIKVKRYESLIVKAHNVKLQNRWVPMLILNEKHSLEI